MPGTESSYSFALRSSVRCSKSTPTLSIVHCFASSRRASKSPHPPVHSNSLYCLKTLYNCSNDSTLYLTQEKKENFSCLFCVFWFYTVAVSLNLSTVHRVRHSDMCLPMHLSYTGCYTAASSSANCLLHIRFSFPKFTKILPLKSACSR